MNDNNQAFYQLAHECVHLLSPTGGNNANNLEEGLAAYNAKYFMRTEMGQPFWNATLPSYIKAEQLVTKIMEFDVRAIKRMRELQFNISTISAEIILKISTKINQEEAQFLASKFVR